MAVQFSPQELAVDKAAIAGINFCSTWPTARTILLGLAGVVSNFMVKVAVNTVVSAGDAYCGASAAPLAAPSSSSSSSSSRLAQFGVTVPAGAPQSSQEALAALSDPELLTVAAIQQKLRAPEALRDTAGGSYF